MDISQLGLQIDVLEFRSLIRVAMAAAAPRSERANSQDSARSAGLFVRQIRPSLMKRANRSTAGEYVDRLDDRGRARQAGALVLMPLFELMQALMTRLMLNKSLMRFTTSNATGEIIERQAYFDTATRASSASAGMPFNDEGGRGCLDDAVPALVGFFGATRNDRSELRQSGRAVRRRPRPIRC